jgi:hypothetical protein
MTVDRQGRVITVGGGLVGGRRYGVVARWLPDGSVDTSFGAGGAARVEYPAGSPARDLVLRAVVADDDGRIVVAGGDVVPLNRATLGVYARLTASGAVDTAFGGVTVDPRFAALVGVVPDGDGYALVGDGTEAGAPKVLYVGPDGRARPDVGDQGAVTHSAPGAAPMVVRAVARDTDGGLVLAGGAGPQVWNQTPLQLVRFTAGRAPDRAWGQRGRRDGLLFRHLELRDVPRRGAPPRRAGELLRRGPGRPRVPRPPRAARRQRRPELRPRRHGQRAADELQLRVRAARRPTRRRVGLLPRGDGARGGRDALPGALVVRRRAPRGAGLSLASRAGALPPHFAPLVTPDTALDAVTDDSRLQMPPNCV